MPEYNIGVKFGATGIDQLKKDVAEANKSLDGVRKTFVQMPSVNLADRVKGIPELRKNADEAKTALEGIGNSFVQMPAVDVSGVVANFRKIPPAVSQSVASLSSYKKSVDQLRADVSKGINPKISLVSFDQLEAKLSSINSRLGKTTDPVLFKRLRDEATRTQQAISSLGRAVATVPAAVSKIPNASNQAGVALTNLGRVAQDAPFGFIGIQNNINPLLESFQRLKQASGTTGGALKALGSSLLGAGGVGLGLSVVTGLITVAVQKYGSLGNAINVVFGLTTNLEQANRDLAKSMAESSGSVAGEVANVQSLVAIANNKALSDNVRTEALNKLNKEYDAYLPKLTLETIGTDKARSAIDALTNSLIRQAKIKGVQDLISKTVSEQAALLVGDISEQASALDMLSVAIKSIGNAQPLNFNQQLSVAGAERAGAAYDKLQERLKVYQNVLSSLNLEEAKAGTLDPNEKEKKSREAVIDQLTKQLQALEKIRKAQQEIADTPITTKRIGILETEGLTREEIAEFTGQRKLERAFQEIDALIKTSEKIYDLKVKILLRDAKKNGLDKSEIDGLKKSYQQDLDKAFLQEAIVREGTVRVKPAVIVDRASLDPEEIKSKVAEAVKGGRPLDLNYSTTVSVQVTGANLRNLEEARKQLEDQFSQFFESFKENLKTDAIVSLGEGIGNAVSGQGLKGLVGPLIGTLADALTQLGKAMIQYGVKLLALKKAFEATKKFFTSNPAVLIAAGVGAVAAGALLRNQFQKSLPKFRDGGIADGPLSGYNVELHGREMIIPLDRLNAAQTFGGRDEMAFAPSIAFSGDMFRIMLNKVDKRKRRV